MVKWAIQSLIHGRDEVRICLVIINPGETDNEEDERNEGCGSLHDGRILELLENEFWVTCLLSCQMMTDMLEGNERESKRS